jgi:hypothetical protein
MKALQFNDPLKKYRESMKALQFNDPLEKYRESMKALQFNDPLEKYREVFQISDPFNKYKESIKIFQKPLDSSQYYSSLKNILDTLSNGKLELNDELHVSDDGVISIGSNEIGQKELQEIAEEIIDNEPNFEAKLDKKIEELIVEVSSLKDPALQKVISWLLYPLIVGIVLSIVNPVADFYIKKSLGNSDKRLIVKKVNKTLKNNIDHQTILSKFRIVTANILNVRESGSNKSAIIGLFYTGYVVEIIQKGRKWSLVSWYDSDKNISIQGWVFSRYLKPIK